MKRIVLAALAGLIAAGALAAPSLAAGKYKHPREFEFSFNGVFGTFERDQLQRGFQVYKQVCSSCHGMKLLAYRNLTDKGGPEFTDAEMRALIKDYTVATIDEDGNTTDADGNALTRPVIPADRFVYPYANEAAGRAANMGAYPPDLSVMAKARKDGPNYIASLFTGYYDPEKVLGIYKCSKVDETKACVEYSRLQPGADGSIPDETGADGEKAARCITEVIPEGPDDTDIPEKVKTCTPKSDTLNYNPYFPGGQIAMPNMLLGQSITLADGTTLEDTEQLAQDVAAFMMWAAEPKLEERKRIGVGVMLFLALLSLLSYMAYRHMWRDEKH
jgi:ubiquinol-cytochrome c reductase cytochrome c1 subunit